MVLIINALGPLNLEIIHFEKSANSLHLAYGLDRNYFGSTGLGVFSRVVVRIEMLLILIGHGVSQLGKPGKLQAPRN